MERDFPVPYMRNKLTPFLIFSLFGFFSRAGAQFVQFNHPELDWRTLDTVHFSVHFHQGTERTASLVAKIAEDIYEPVTSLYEYRPDGKIHFIIRDHDDNSNGAAFYYDNKVEIWAPPSDFLLRGDHAWLRDVVAHEFSHMISLAAARKMPRRIPAIYFQWFGYEKEKRSDVIHGYPNTLASFPVAGTVIPMWFAEGMAQAQRAGLDYDTWDTHRDMLLRTAALDGSLLSLEEMGVFGKNSLGNERTYCQGYSLTLYISRKYGEGKLRELASAMRKPHFIGFSQAAREVLGISEKQLYREWRSFLEAGYRDAVQPLKERLREGLLIEKEGSAGVYPAFSPDGRRAVYVSNPGQDYMGLRSLYLTDSLFSGHEKIAAGVHSSASWSPDGGRLVFSRRAAGKHGSKFYDLFIYDLKKHSEKRITRSSRARLPDWSPDGSRIVSVVEKDGSSNLAVIRPDGSGLRPITAFENGEQIFSPKWTADGSGIVFALFTGQGGRDIAQVDSGGANFRYVVKRESDDRDPEPDPSGKWLYFSSDRTGIFNIHRMDLETGSTDQVTTVSGGAFMPSVDGSGRILYSLFQADGFKIALLENSAAPDAAVVFYGSQMNSLESALPVPEWDIARYDDRAVPEYESRPYKTVYGQMTVMPRIFMDYPGKPKFGTYFFSTDVLDQLSVLGTVAANSSWDTDVYGSFSYRRFAPSLFIDLYHMRRHNSERKADYLFTLMGTDLGADWAMTDNDLVRTAFLYSRYDAKQTLTDAVPEIKFSYTYHKGSALQLKWTHRSIPPALNSGIAPKKGQFWDLDFTYNRDNFINGFEVHQNYGTLVEAFRSYPYFRILGEFRNYRSLAGSWMMRLKWGWIDRRVDSFYNLFAGGLDGLKGYPYYSLEGRKLIHAELAYRFPILRKAGLRLLFIQLDNLYGSLYGQAGNAFDTDRLKEFSWRRTAGFQLRSELFGFYGYPVKLFADAAYGLDGFSHAGQDYGKEWRFYFGLLFDFLD